MERIWKMKKMAAVFLNNSEDMINHVYAQGRREQVAELTQLYPVVVSAAGFAAHSENLTGVEVVFSTWGMPPLTVAELERLPSLKAVFYAAGSVKGFAYPFLDRGIIVCSAWAANAVSVAEFCLGQILLACKGYFRNTRDCRTPPAKRTARPFYGKGAYGETVALIGAGQIGKRLIELLRPFRLDILVVDPYLSEAEAQALKVRKATLEEVFSKALVVSNHLPNLPSLQKVLDGKLFESMRPGAVFINTGRGAQVNEPELVDVLRRRPDLLALLDVTFPEPPPEESAFYALPNVQLTSHIAGAHDDEVVRMADYMLEEFRHWQAGEPLRYSLTAEMLERMA
jgi:phosphoglycerate dehydrogenase-like enzyme